MGSPIWALGARHPVIPKVIYHKIMQIGQIKLVMYTILWSPHPN